MNDWPDRRTGDRSDRYGRGSASPQPEGARAMPHIQRRPSSPQRPQMPPQRPQVPPQSQGYDDRYQDGGYGNPEPGYDSGYNTGQVYGGSGGSGRGGGGRRGGGDGGTWAARLRTGAAGSSSAR